MAREVSPWLPVGRVGRPHGLDGSFHVTQPRGDLLLLGESLRVGERETRIERRAGTDERPIVRVEGVGDRAAVEALRGAALTRRRSETPPLGPDEWWAEDLEGCRVMDATVEVGVVRGLLALPSCEALEVELADGGQLLVPLVRDAVRAVDVEAGVIDVDLEFLGVAPTVAPDPARRRPPRPPS